MDRVVREKYTGQAGHRGERFDQWTDIPLQQCPWTGRQRFSITISALSHLQRNPTAVIIIGSNDGCLGSESRPTGAWQRSTSHVIAL